MKRIDLSVHQLVDFVLRTGDIDNRIFSRSSMNEGSLLHALYQSKQGEDYLSEYPLQTSIIQEGIEVHIEGRADGIIKRSKKRYVIDEIKTTVIDLNEFNQNNEAWHLGQAQLYGYMFCLEKELDSIEIRLTYISQKHHSDRLIKNYTYSLIELTQIINGYVEEYLDFYHLVEIAKTKRNESLINLSFPFPSFRKGQLTLTKYAYGLASKGGRLFVEAPTGIGKTISTLYPFIKSYENNEDARIFYLTAKASGKTSAKDAVNIVRKSGASLSDIIVTSKEKICFCKDKACNPDECPFTKGYYTKIKQVLREAILNYQEFDYDLIVNIAKEYEICPFEFELDLSLFMDVIICDYNYVFDPISYMHRYFDEDGSKYLLLIDEAHNLVDRSRDMYSASILEEEFLLAKKSLKKTTIKPLKTVLAKFNKYFKNLHENFLEENNQIATLDDETIKLIYRFNEIMLDINKNQHEEVTKELTTFYLSVNRFIKIYEIANDSFIFNIKNINDTMALELICLDASSYLSAINHRVKASIFFSATLTPTDYYIDTLGGDLESDAVLKLGSPFPKENFLLLVAPKVSIKYKNREKTYGTVVDYIKAFISKKIGNYLIFVPSYEYLMNIAPMLESLRVDYYLQNKEMNEADKIAFISHFETNPTKTTLGFAILGGSFSEGIDLVSDRLIGAVVVGIGMPRINFISDKIMELYNANEKPGRNYAYIYPGMNKVMQAVGRVIRHEDDKGVVLLIDERYATNQYKDLFKKEWSNYEVVFSTNDIEEAISTFYKL